MTLETVQENPFSISDERLKILLDSFSASLDLQEHIEWAKEREKSLLTTLLDKDYLSKVPKKDFVEIILQYTRQLDGPSIYYTEDRIGKETSRLKRNLRYIIESDDDPFVKATRILEGDYQIPYFSRGFWTIIFQARYPNLLPNWNSKTDRFFKALDVDLTTRKVPLEERYRLLSRSFQHLETLDPRQDFHTLDSLMHYGIAVPEGKDLVAKLKSGGAKTVRPSIGIFTGFSREAFELLETLAADTSYDAVMKTTDKIHEVVVHPMGNLFSDIAQDFDTADILGLEKKNRVVAQLWKQFPVKLGAWPFVWGAFYQKGVTRSNSMQFFVWMDKDILTHGVYPSMNKPENRKRIIDNIRKYGDRLNKYFSASIFEDFSFFTDYSKDKPRAFFSVKSLQDLARLFEDHNLNIGKVMSPKEVIASGQDLVGVVGASFRRLVPLYVLGLEGDPIMVLEAYYAGGPPSLKISKDELLEDVFLDENQLDHLLELLTESERRQVVLQGPPGTGKTYIAKRIAMYIAESEDRVETIQFHPSYSYEDFVEGYRPTEDGFELVDGVFKTFSKKALGDPENHYVLVIDEINRGNLSKIFGELLFLLEYRGEEVSLTYSRETAFSIPENLHIIGTMNTADRSLAIMDYALRRRFWFFPLYCNVSRLGPWLEASGCRLEVPELLSRIQKINETVSADMMSKDFAIGHSYFMRDDLDEEKLKAVIEYQLSPLLEEYYFDRPERVGEILKDIRDYAG